MQDPSTVPLSAALRSRNVEFTSGMVGVRHGFKAAGGSFASVVGVVELYCWYAPFSQINSSYSDSATILAGGTTIAGQGVLSFQINTIAGSGGLSAANLLPTSPAPAGASFVGVGMRLYTATFGSKQQGLSGGGVTTASASGGVAVFTSSGAINLFTGPSTYTPAAATEPAAGVVTAGTHRFGYLIEYASGFTTRVSPDSGATSPPSITTFSPITKVAAGAKNLVFTITNTWGSEVVAISLVMTTVTNLNQYYVVPGSRTAVSASFTITVSISDADLSSQAVDATPYLYWLTQSATAGGLPGTAPFYTRHLALLGDRMAYLGTVADNKGNVIDALYVSERNNYQAITPDQHVVQLPGQRTMTSMFRMGGMNYITGPHEISGVTDNGDVPVSWAAPSLIDGRHGTLALHGIEVAPSGNYAWLADQAGLFVFTGAPITGLPVSYQQMSDWDRINWGAAYCLKIKDDAGSKRVRVMAALDGATTPSHILTWDYTNGVGWNQVNYSLDNISGYALGSMELVRNDLAGQATGNQQKIELWVGSSAADNVLRQMSDLDTTPWRDATSTAISAAYRTCPLPGRDAAGGLILQHHGFHARLKGAGTITPVLYDIDAVRSFTCRTVTLSSAPDSDVLCLADLRGELAFIEFATATADTHWQLAYLQYFSSPYLMQR